MDKNKVVNTVKKSNNETKSIRSNRVTLSNRTMQKQAVVDSVAIYGNQSIAACTPLGSTAEPEMVVLNGVHEEGDEVTVYEDSAGNLRGVGGGSSSSTGTGGETTVVSQWHWRIYPA